MSFAFGLVSVLTWVPWLALFAIPLQQVFARAAGSQLLVGILDPVLLSKVGFTAWQAAWSAAFAGGLGLVWGLALRGYPRAHGWLRVPFGIPTVAAVAAWTSILRGTDTAYSAEAVILVHVVFNVPWVALAVAQACASVPRVWDEQARSLGAGRVHRLRAVWWPVVGPAWLGSMVQVFGFCVSSFVIVLVLGGGPPVETLETAIYSSVRSGMLDLSGAARLALWQVLLSLGPWLLVRRLFLGNGLVLQLRAQAVSAGLSKASVPWAPFLAHGFAAIWLVPYLFFLKDLALPEFGFASFWSGLKFPVFLSVGIAACSAMISVLWAGIASAFLVAARFRGEGLLLLPSGLSTLTLCMGFWLAYSQWVDPFEGSLAALILIQGVVFFPLVLRSFIPVAGSRPVRLWELARTQGASPWQAFWLVEWPRWRAPVWSSLAMVSAASLGEVAAVSFFGSERLVTASGLISRWMSLYRFEQAYLLTAVLMFISLLLALVPQFVSKGELHEP